MIRQRTKYTNIIIDAIETLPIVILIGARQVGKTTLINNLPLKGDVLYMDGQDPDVAALFLKKSTIENYLEIHLNKEKKGYFLIDEFQFINNISTILKLLVDHNNLLKIICTGSSSIDILQKVNESLAGRVRVIEIYSLSFEEHLEFTNPELWEIFKKYNKETEHVIVHPKIKLLFDEYLVYGGMPRVAAESDLNKKVELLNDIFKTYLLRDVRQFVKNEDFVGFNKLLRFLSTQIGCMINVNNLSKESGLNYKRTEEYLYILEQMYIIKLVEPFYTNKRKIISKMKKVFFTDHGLRNIIYHDFKEIDDRADNGGLFENFVFLEIIRNTRKSAQINYYRTIDGSEVDFVINTMYKKISIEVKFKNINKVKYFKNIEILNDNENISQSYIINRSWNEKNNNIQYIQAYLMNKIDFE